MSAKIPIVLISGYLGAGKTTLLGNLLESDALEGKRIAVLVNEFGALPIDGALLPSGDYHLTEVNKGSVFCVCVKTDLIRSFEEIAVNFNPDVLLMEATGIAEPRDISALKENDLLKSHYGESVCVTVVDCVNFPKLNRILPALSAQVRAADLILLNKTDMAAPESVESVERGIRGLNKHAGVVKTTNCVFNFDLDALLAKKAAYAGLSDLPACSLAKSPPSDVEKCELRLDFIPNRVAFYGFLDKHRGEILRGKGVVDFGTSRIFVEVVNGAVASRPAGTMEIGASEHRVAMSFVLRGTTCLEFKHAASKLPRGC